MSLNPASATGYPGITFPVDDVEPLKRSIYSESLKSSLKRRLFHYPFHRDLHVLPDEERRVANTAISNIPEERRHRIALQDIGSHVHPLLDAVHTAFSQHRPLALSPDCIWLIIAQGFGHHMTENAEALRHRLVRHQGKRKLSIDVLDLSTSSFEHAIASISRQIRDASDPVLHETLICDFSTTTQDIRTASEVVLMDCFSRYFEYSMICICGIPAITLTGTVED